MKNTNKFNQVGELSTKILFKKIKKISSLLVLACTFSAIFLSCTAQETKSETSKKPKYKNRLANAKSPYLREHSDNPVDWYEWGNEALEKAKKENKPIIISIGYAACHWCHVMEEESFMDPEIAEIMNKNFINIKIDREERPDIDDIYMTASMLTNKSGGWPLNAIALPDTRPFFVGTYFRKKQWKSLLNQIISYFKYNHKKAVEQAEKLSKGIQSTDLIPLPKLSKEEIIDKNNYLSFFDKWKNQIDNVKGGLNRVPRFPMPAVWEALLQYHYFTGKQKAYDLVENTLDKMGTGGIYDQIGGGFARYSTDGIWKVPHFEKMLYDNAQLISVYSHAYQIKAKPRYKEIIQQTLDFVKRELTDKNGGFYSSLNADSEGEEGLYYVWTMDEINEHFNGEEKEFIVDFYNFKPAGNWEHKRNILFPQQSIEKFATKKKMEVAKAKKILATINKKLFTLRQGKIRPSTDDKILTSWNAMMSIGFIDAYRALGDKDYLEMAQINIDFLIKNQLNQDGSLHRSYSKDNHKIHAFLTDYAYLSMALIKLYEVTFESRYLFQAKALTAYVLKNFADENHLLFYFTDQKQNALIARKKETYDNVIPSSNSVFAHVLHDLGVYFYEKKYIKLAEGLVHNMGVNSVYAGPFMANWTQLLGKMVFPNMQIVITGKKALKKAENLHSMYLPNALFAGGIDENIKILYGKIVKGKTMVYVCENKICLLPVSDTELAKKEIEKINTKYKLNKK